jgi:hypothetical protein
MKLDVFAEACQRLASGGFGVDKAQYDDQVFGSWFIELSDARRIVWDGKEALLRVQARRGTEWQDLWIERDRAEQTVGRAMQELRAAQD